MVINIVRQSIIAFFVLFLLIVKTYAQEVLPNGCIAVVIKNDIVTLKVDKNMFIFIHNLSEENVWLVNQADVDNPQSALSSEIVAGTWSALALNQAPQELKLSCIESKPGHEQKVSCQDVLAICQWPNTKISEDKKGIFFVAESMDLSGLTAYSERNGYSLS